MTIDPFSHVSYQIIPDEHPRALIDLLKAKITSFRLVMDALRHGADAAAQDEKEQTCLHYIVKASSHDLIATLVQFGADVNAKDKEGKTALYTAAELGAIDCVIALLANDASADIGCNERNMLPLHAACQKGHADIVKVLLPATSDRYATTTDGYNALHYAAANGSVEIGTYLVEQAEFDPSAKTGGINMYATPLLIACYYNRPDFVAYIQQKTESTTA